MLRAKTSAALALVLVAAAHLSTIPRTIWEFDECFFAMAVEQYQPLLHHPPPPGYPLYIGFAKLFGAFMDPFVALVGVSILATLAGFLAWVAAFRAITNEWIGLAAALVLYLSPAALVSGTLPQSDAGALALFGLAAWGCVRAIGPEGGSRQAALFGLLAAACVGWRQQFAIVIVPMLAVSILLMLQWKTRFTATLAFGLGCLAWLIPLVVAAGGPESYWNWLSGQAAYYAAHDADLSRSGQSAAQIALRFVAHPWGPKWLSLPLLALAGVGLLLVLRRRLRGLLPLAGGCLAYLAFALATMDPADAVRYAIPSLPLLALLAAVSGDLLRRLRTPDSFLSLAAAAAVLYGIGAYAYSWPVLRARTRGPAPPAAAADWIRANVPKNAIVLYDLPLRPHADFLLRGWRTMRIDAGMAASGGDATVPMVLYADGERAGAAGVSFRWPETDAYRKLTRRHYGAVSVIPLPPAERYRVIDGVFAPERTRDGRAWRWLGARGVLEIPDLGAAAVKIVLRAPPEYPLEQNRVRVAVHDQSAGIVVRRDAQSETILPVPRGPVQIVITPEQTFIPANVPGANNRDRRTLSVMLVKVEQQK